MATDIFNNEASALKGYKLGKTIINIENGDKLVCQSAQFQYTQNVQPVTPLNKDYKYLVVGDSTGTGALNLIMGPSENVKAFLEKYGDACQADGTSNYITLESSDACNNSGGGDKFTLRGILITSIGSQIQRSQGGIDMIIVSVQFMFNELEMN